MQIGVLTGGGDCGGLNAAIRAVVIRAARGGHTVVGVADGWAGMLDGRGAELTPKDVAGIVGLGGTILGSSRTNPAKNAEDMERVRANFAQLRLDALIAIGGDDTLSVAAKLAARDCRWWVCPRRWITTSTPPTPASASIRPSSA